jgi:hypothetical protein
MNTQLPVHLHDGSLKKPAGANIHYWAGTSATMIVIERWVMVFSKIMGWNPDLFSQGYRNCIGIAWISPTGTKVLGHLCPGTFYPNNPAKFGTTFIRIHQERIREILGNWVEEGWFTHNEQWGLLGSCVFPTSWEVGVKGYFETLDILGGMLGSVLPGDPQILAEPSLGDKSQDVVVREDGVHIYKVLPVIRYQPETHFTPAEIKGRVRNRMPK